MRQPVPELEPTCNSWILTHPRAMCPVELYDRNNVEKLVAAGWTAKTALQHLIDLNKELANG